MAARSRSPDLSIEEYDKAKHFDLINSWLAGWGYEPRDDATMPNVGYVVGGCVAQLLMLTDCRIVWYDGFFSDPESDPILRKRSIETAHQLCSEWARAHGFVRVITFVTRQHVLETALKSYKDNGSAATSTQGFMLEGML